MSLIGRASLLSNPLGQIKTYVDDVFSTYLYTGTGPGSGQTITNGIDLAGQGGIVWIKERGASSSHYIFDTIRGGNNSVSSDLTLAAISRSGALTSFTNNGFTLGTDPNTIGVNRGGVNTVSWTFRKAPKFFDVVTFATGTRGAVSFNHSLGIVPGCVMLKSTGGAQDWIVAHRSLGDSSALILNSADASVLAGWSFSSNFTASSVNIAENIFSGSSGESYVAYLFAHDPDPVDGLIQCGSFTTDGSGAAPSVNLGWEPQWLLFKPTTAALSWEMYDVNRGLAINGGNLVLQPNTTNAESSTGASGFAVNATGFAGFGNNFGAARDVIYIAIRRPNKPPTTGTQVFEPATYTGNGSVSASIASGFPIDLVINSSRSVGSNKMTVDRLRGLLQIQTDTANAEASSANGVDKLDQMSGVTIGSNLNSNGNTFINWYFKRAPGFFDVVAYTGVTTPQSLSHNLQAIPEFIIVKSRNLAQNWAVYFNDPISALNLNTNGTPIISSSFWNNTAPTSTTFTVGTDITTNASANYIAYLFSSLPGISKTGFYTGNGSTKTIDCGFSTGARFVLIKRTDAAGDWYVWDTARGIVADNDPHLSLNTITAEVTTNDSIDPTPSGFIINQVTDTNINLNLGIYIFFAIA